MGLEIQLRLCAIPLVITHHLKEPTTIVWNKWTSTVPYRIRVLSRLNFIAVTWRLATSNPTIGEVNFDFSSPSETIIHIIITDVTGRVVKDEFRQVKAGTTPINTMINEEGAGIYTLSVTEEKSGFRSVERIVKF